jgi:hypothetical protein
VDVWGIPATVLLWLFPAVRAFGAFDDVIMGLIADRTNTRWGKFRPYLLFGAIPYGVCGYLMFAGPDFGPRGKIIYAAVTYALMLLSYTIINVPYSAMLGVISPSPRTRTVASTCRFVGAFGAAFLISLAELQRAGHASLVETQNGETYMVYLVGRPLRNRGRCTLGRETAIQKMVWGEDDWLRTLDGEGIPTIETPAPELPVHKFSPAPTREDFNSPELPIDFQWLRTPRREEIFSLTARPGFLRLFGRETIGSSFRQSLLARRQQSHCFSASTVAEFEPEHFQQLAGLVCYYNSTKFHYFYLSHDETVGKHLRVMSCVPDLPQADTFTPPITISTGKPVHLRVEVDYERMHFAYRVEGVGADWRWLPQQFDASIFSDECSAPGQPNFTGAFIGMACQDLAGTGKHADFDFFEYDERTFRPDFFGSFRD